MLKYLILIAMTMLSLKRLKCPKRKDMINNRMKYSKCDYVYLYLLCQQHAYKKEAIRHS